MSQHLRHISTDLHVHTTCSDGALSPEDIVKKASNSGVTVLAITDHDTTEAYLRAEKEATLRGIRLITGVEISCFENNREVHLLGYNFDIKNEKLQERLALIRSERSVRAIEIVNKLQALGLSITIEEVMLQANGGTVGRPHVASALVANGSVATVFDAFALYLHDWGKAYVPKQECAVGDMIELIHNAGGIASLAHPSNLVKMRDIVRFVDMGLDGIEVYHPSHTRYKTNYFRTFAKQYEILATGGSDYHGTRDQDEANFGRFPVEEFTLHVLLDKVKHSSS